MKNGIARSVNPVVEAYILCGSMVSSEAFSRPVKNMIAVRAIATAIGMSIIISSNNTVKIIKVSILWPLQGGIAFDRARRNEACRECTYYLL
jgi:hypothetical protein